MKAYTDLEQSKKLAEILPIESADMYYSYYGNPKYNHIIAYEGEQWFLCHIRNSLHTDIPCWSLAALLGVLPVSCDDGQHCLSLMNPNHDDKTEWLCTYEDCYGDLKLECYTDNSIDACYEIILKLHELKML